MSLLSRIRAGTNGERPRFGPASIAAVLVAIAIVLAVALLASPSFQEAFGSNFLATVAGVALGFPIAIWLTLQESAAQERTTREREASETAARRGQVLSALQRELTENKQALSSRRASGARQFFATFLQDEVWSAMSDGGELRWINDPPLLRQLARSYHFIRTLNFLEREAFAAMHYPGIQIAAEGGKGSAALVVQRITGYLDKLDEVIMAAIDEGLAAISNPDFRPS